MTGAPQWLLLAVGLTTTALGMYLAARPLSALQVLGLYVGVSCIISGAGDLLSHRAGSARGFLTGGLVWVVGGLAVVVWVGRSIELLGPVVAVVLTVSGVIRIAGWVRARTAAHALTALFGLAELGWGLTALTWPDATLLVVAVLFGGRTAMFGISLIWRGVAGLRATRSRAAAPHPPAPAAPGDPSSGWKTGFRWLTAVLVVVVAAGVLSGSYLFRQGVPVIDGFYDAPQSVPPGPGHLIRSEPYDGRLPTGLRAYKLLYTTTATDGTPALASGVLAVPADGSRGPAPVIAWAHGTVGVARGCAPSIGPDAISTVGMPAMDSLARNGWAMVATDYTGMGAPGRFPYLIGPGEGHSVLDSVRAARQVPEVRLADRTVVWGHSQGGHGALWAGQLAASYAPDVRVMGTAALSPAADPLALARTVAAHPGAPGASLATAFVADAYSRTYDDISLERILAPAARTVIKEAASRCTSEKGTLITILAGLAIARDQPVLRPDALSGPVGRRLRDNIPLGPWSAPLFIAQGTSDEVIPIGITRDYVPRACASGAHIEFQSYDGRTHMSVLEPDSPLTADLERWTEDRLTGRTAAATCGTH